MPSQPPLSYVASSSSDPQISHSLPPEVITCLKNARFLHLATCESNKPNVSLMAFTYFPSTPFQQSPTIVMTTNSVSKKTFNLVANPHVSLLVHDWVSHRPPTRGPAGRDGSPIAVRAQSGLAAMLMNMNTSALSRISATINGEARLAETGGEEERWCKEQHLQNNTFGDDAENAAALFGTSPSQSASADANRNGSYIEGEAVRVVVVTIKDGRIADWQGGVTDWAISTPDNGPTSMVNGV